MTPALVPGEWLAGTTSRRQRQGEWQEGLWKRWRRREVWKTWFPAWTRRQPLELRHTPVRTWARRQHCGETLTQPHQLTPHTVPAHTACHTQPAAHSQPHTASRTQPAEHVRGPRHGIVSNAAHQVGELCGVCTLTINVWRHQLISFQRLPQPTRPGSATHGAVGNVEVSLERGNGTDSVDGGGGRGWSAGVVF